MMLDEISAYLATTFAATTPSLAEGVNLFLSRTQDSPDFCVSLYESPVSMGQYMLDGGKRVWEETSLQVIVREAEYNYLAARQFVERITNLLDAVNDVTLSGTRYIRIRVESTPLPLPADTQDRILLSVNFHIIKDLSAVTSP